MPFRRRKILRATMGKTPIKHSRTLVTVIGQGSSVGQLTLIKTNTGDRSLDGTAKVIQEQGSTGDTVQVGEVTKYVNIVLQAAITEEGQTTQNDMQGWIEWAVVWRNEVDIPIPSTKLGTQALQDIAMQMFRGDCLMTGQFPVSVNLPNVQTVTIKLPKKAIKWKLGNELTLRTHFRSSNTTDLDTNTVKLILFHYFKSYS